MTESSEKNLQMQKLFEAAHRDPELRMKLLTNPEEVAKEWDVQFDKREVAQLRKTGAFLQVADEVLAGSLYPPCKPEVCYPVTVWRYQAVVDLASIIEKWRWVYYPPRFLAFQDRIRRMAP